MIAFLIGAGVGLLAGAGLGCIVAALMAKARIVAAEEALDEVEANNRHMQVHCAEMQERCDRYVGELDALVEATRPAPEIGDCNDCGPVVCERHTNFPTPAEVARAILTPDADAPRTPSFDPNPTILLGPGQTYTQWYAAYAERLDVEQPGWWDHMHPNAAGELVRLAEERRHETFAQNELDHDRIPTRHGFDARHRPGMAIYPRWETTSDGEAR